VNILNFIFDPLDTLLSLLIALPGVLLALSAHEAAHGWVANRCGDPTAKLMGRITLNPLKHIDPVGFLCMLFAGFGWAKPVPVDPLLFRNYRKDDLRVSLAGITANLLLFIISFAILMSASTIAYANVPKYGSFDGFIEFVDEGGYVSEDGIALRAFAASYEDEGETHIAVFDKGDTVFVYQKKSPIRLLPDTHRTFYYAYTQDEYFKEDNVFGGYRLISTVYGRAASIVYEMVLTFALLNLSLAVFNLIPLPPLDGYHVLNDLVLKRPLFADIKAQRIGTGILFALIMIGNVDPRLDILAIAIDFVQTNMTGIFAKGWYALMNIINII